MDALQGLKVLELGQLIAGPFAGKTLADFGADVIKIEAVDGGDPLRTWRLLREGTSVWWECSRATSAPWRWTCAVRRPGRDPRAGRRSRRADRELQAGHDGRLGPGLGRAACAEPKLVMLRISGYGQTGPYRGSRASACWARRWAACVTSPPSRAACRCAWACPSATRCGAARRDRRADGAAPPRGQRRPGPDDRLALYESVFNVMESLLPEYDAFGAVRGAAGSALPGIAPSNAYRCGDGAYVLVAGNGDSIFRRLMTAIGRADLAADPGLARNDGRVTRVGEIDGAIEAWTSQRPITEVIALLDAAGVPVGRIYTVADIAADPQYLARDMILQTQDVHGRPLKVPGIVPKLSDTPGRLRTPAPTLGQHTAQVVGTDGWPAAANDD